MAAAADVRPSPLRAGLIWTLVRTDFKARYHGTATGFAWALLKPIAIFLVLLTVFSFLFTDPRYKLNLMIGLFLWDFFAESTKTGLASLHAKGFILTKVRAPLPVIVITSLANPLLTLLVFCVAIAGVLTFSGYTPSLSGLMLFVAYCAAMFLTCVGFSLASSVLFLRYRDLNQVWDVVAQAGFFVAPIVYPLGIVPERFHFYFYLWPPTPIIEFSRAVLVAGKAPTMTAHIYLAVEVLVVLGMGWAIFRRFSPRAAEYV